MRDAVGEILDFWFSDSARGRWFVKDPAFDDEIGRRFKGLAAEAAAGELSAWESAPEGSLALVLLLDQFPRNMYRENPRAFSPDGEARRVARLAVDRGLDCRIALDRRFFFYMPFEHSEEAGDQARSVALFRRWVDEHPPAAKEKAEEQFRYVLRHQEIIRRFGRFPHRNRVLGRPTAPAEEEFLKEPHSSF